MDKNAPVKPGKKSTIMHEAALAFNYSTDHKETIQFILDNYPEIINAQDDDGNTALHIAIQAYKVHKSTDQLKDVFSQLRAGSVNNTIKNNAGQTPLKYLETIHNTTPISKFEDVKAALI